jgi:hypothetical protein
VPFDRGTGWLGYDDAQALRAYVGRQYATGRFGLLDSFDLHATDSRALAAL